ncbi:MAG: ABC transporter permease [Actinobacteria bacterium]|nr:ABC transporter permease [Actinomycetota bacterium]
MTESADLATGSEIALGVDPADIGRAPSSLRVFVGGVLRSWGGRIGVAILLLLVLVAVIGPLVRPHSPDAVIGIPFQPPGGGAPLGTDILGRDVFSRVLSGGWLLLAVAVSSTVVAYLVGGTLGIWAGYRRGRPIDLGTVVVSDTFISIPPIVFALILVAGLGAGAIVVAAAITAVQIPPVIRLVRSFALTVTQTEYVEAAVARGERTPAILRREILPNLWPLIMADFGIRLAYSVILFASLSFLGFGQAPPAADWGLMISENRGGIVIQPWAVLVPVFAIAALAIGTNLAGDAFARSVSRSGRRG